MGLQVADVERRHLARLNGLVNWLTTRPNHSFSQHLLYPTFFSLWTYSYKETGARAFTSWHKDRSLNHLDLRLSWLDGCFDYTVSRLNNLTHWTEHSCCQSTLGQIIWLLLQTLTCVFKALKVGSHLSTGVRQIIRQAKWWRYWAENTQHLAGAALEKACRGWTEALWPGLIRAHQCFDVSEGILLMHKCTILPLASIHLSFARLAQSLIVFNCLHNFSVLKALDSLL